MQLYSSLAYSRHMALHNFPILSPGNGSASIRLSTAIFKWNPKLFIQQNAIEIVVRKMLAIFFQEWMC